VSRHSHRAPTERSSSTRDRVLDAAGEVFGRRGYRAATVREICRLAGASVAAVNYYFRDKEGLYLTVMKELLRSGLERYPPDAGLGPRPTPEERLRAFIRATLFRLLGKQGWYGAAGKGQLLAREITDPSPSMDTLVEQYLRPQKDLLISIVGKMCGAGVPAEHVERCALSIMGQCLHHAYASPIISRLGLSQGSDPGSIERLAEHIVLFSLGGVERVRKAAVAAISTAGHGGTSGSGGKA